MASYSLDAGTFPDVLDQYLWDRSRCSFIMGPLGSGKTYASIVRLLILMQEQEPNAQGVRPTRFVAVRNTYPDLTTTTIKDFQEIFTPELGTMKMGSAEPPTYRVSAHLADGTSIKSEVIFLALDRAEAVKKLRGIQATGFWLNEAKELEKPIIDMADLRHGRYPSEAAGGVTCTWHGMFGDTNAPDEDSWYFKMAEQVQPKEWSFLRQPGGLFPTGNKKADGTEVFIPNSEAENLPHLPEGYYDRGQAGKADDWIRVNLCNEYGFLVDGRPVHPEYVDSKHCATEEIEYDPALPLLLGIDFGRTPAACAVQFLPQWGRYVAIDEFVSEDMSQQLFAPELRVWLNDRFKVTVEGLSKKVRGWSDPAGEAKGQATEDTPRQILIANGIPVLPAPSNSPTLRRVAIANPARRLCMDGMPAFQISPRCRMLRKGLMGGFCYRKLKVPGADRFHEVPDKNIYSHIVEACEYVLLGEGEGVDALTPADDYGDGDPNEGFQEFALLD